MVKNEQLKLEQSRRQNNVIAKFDNGNKFVHRKYEVLGALCKYYEHLYTCLLPLNEEISTNINKTEITENLMKMKKKYWYVYDSIFYFTMYHTLFFNGTQIGYI